VACAADVEHSAARNGRRAAAIHRSASPVQLITDRHVQAAAERSSGQHQLRGRRVGIDRDYCAGDLQARTGGGNTGPTCGTTAEAEGSCRGSDERTANAATTSKVERTGLDIEGSRSGERH